MRRTYLSRLALVAVLVVAAGCSSNKGKIEGSNWVSLETTLKGETLPPGARQMQFNKDGQLIFIVVGKVYKGFYSLGLGPAVTFTLDQEFEGRKIHPYKIVIDGKQLTMTRADGNPIIFQRMNYTISQ